MPQKCDNCICDFICTKLISISSVYLTLFNIYRINVHKALCDNIDTRTTLDHIRDMITEANKYMNNNAKVSGPLSGRNNEILYHLVICLI